MNQIKKVVVKNILRFYATVVYISFSDGTYVHNRYTESVRYPN